MQMLAYILPFYTEFFGTRVGISENLNQPLGIEVLIGNFNERTLTQLLELKYRSSQSDTPCHLKH